MKKEPIGGVIPWLLILSIVMFLIALPVLKAHSADRCPVAHSTVNVTTVSGQVAAAAHCILILQNYSDTPIYCNLAGAAAVVGAGVVLDQAPGAGRPGGGIFFDQSVPIGAVNCIHNSTGNKVLLVTTG